MKQFYILLALFAILLSSCKKDKSVSENSVENESAVKGKWLLKSQSVKRYNSLNVIILDTTLADFDEYTYMEFNDNGNGVYSYAAGSGNKLTFKYTVFKNVLTISRKDNQSGMVTISPYEILKLTPTELRVKFDHVFKEENTSYRDVSEEYYTR